MVPSITKVPRLKCVTLLNKYVSFNSYRVPEINFLIISVSLQNFLIAYDAPSKKEKSTALQVKAFLFLYLYFAVVPHIDITFKKNKLNVSEAKTAVKVVLVDSFQIQNFFKMLHIESVSLLHLVLKYHLATLTLKCKNVITTRFIINSGSLFSADELSYPVLDGLTVPLLALNLKVNYNEYHSGSQVFDTLKNLATV
jgi:hypothetical protein